VTARVAEDPVKDPAGTVYHCGLLVEPGSRSDVSGDRQNSLYPVKGPEGHLEYCESVERADLGGLTALLDVNCVSKCPDAGEPARDPRKLTRGSGYTPVEYDRVERVVRRVWSVEGQAELFEPLAHAIGHGANRKGIATSHA
jgi:hypothetical protein